MRERESARERERASEREGERERASEREGERERGKGSRASRPEGRSRIGDAVGEGRTKAWRVPCARRGHRAAEP